MITPTQKWRKYRTECGICINEDCEKVIQKYLAPNFEGKIQLILTSPPFRRSEKCIFSKKVDLYAVRIPRKGKPMGGGL